MEEITLENILLNNQTDNVFHTHVSLLRPKGKYLLNRYELENFWSIYCKKIHSEQNPIIGIAEKPQTYLPVLVDVDLKIKDDQTINFGDCLYTQEQVDFIISIYQSTLRNMVNNCDDSNLMCVLLEKPMYFISYGENNYIKNGFHLHFPNLFLSKIDQEVHLIPRIKNIIRDQRLFQNLGIEDSSIVIDSATCSVPWLLYGSRKSEEIESYLLSRIYNSSGQEISIEEAFSNYKIYDCDENEIDLTDREKIEFNLPRILSIIPYNRKTTEIKEGLISPLKEKMRLNKFIKSNGHLQNRPSITITESLEITERLLPMIADWRAENYNEWMTIGWALYNIGDASEDALNQWIEFSHRCQEKVDDAKCIYEWSRMQKKNITMGTLRWYASQDNPEMYRQFQNEKSEPFFQKAISGSHNDIAKILYNEFSNEFVCSSIVNKIWYQYRDHHWDEIEEGVFLRKKISDDIAQYYSKLGSKLFTEVGKTQDKIAYNNQNNVIKQIQKLIGNLKSAPFKSNIMKEAMEEFYDCGFRNRLNQNPNIFGFKNGVYDLKTLEFRPGRPEDYISKVAPIEYIEYNPTDPEIQEIVSFLTKIFPDESIRKYFLDIYSDIFVGGNSQKKVYLWTGEGDNGKSITQHLIESMLGEMSIKFNTQYFTGKKVSTGSANPELSRAAPPVRSVFMEEPDADEQLNIGELKKLSGGDSFWARDLFEKGKNTREVFPFFMLSFVCNKLPKIKYSDKATWNRLRVIPFESTFVDPAEPCPETWEEQLAQKKFPMDKDLKAKIPNMRSPLAWYLLEWRKNVGTIHEPAKVREATAMYRRQNDIFRQYIDECLIYDSFAKISLSEIFANFREFIREGWPSFTCPIKNDVREYIEKVWGEPEQGMIWSGYRLRTPEDNNSSDSCKEVINKETYNNIIEQELDHQEFIDSEI